MFKENYLIVLLVYYVYNFKQWIIYSNITISNVIQEPITI